MLLKRIAEERAAAAHCVPQREPRTVAQSRADRAAKIEETA